MVSKITCRILLSVILIISIGKAFAQFSANAGNNVVVCANDTVVLGGQPTGNGGSPPYKYLWSPSSGLSSATVVNPVVQPLVSTWYHVTVTDSLGHTAIAAVMVTVRNPSIINITADTNVTCGEPVQLLANGVASSCSLGVIPNGNSLAQVGTGTLSQSGSAVSPPFIFGNFMQSNRQQMLYNAAEINAAVGGQQAIKGIEFNINQLNSNEYIQHVTISMGCTSIDSLSTWQDALQEVGYYDAVQPVSGWNPFVFVNSFNWDGVSNIVVDICSYEPFTYGNQGNKAQCTNTAHNSYLYVQANGLDLCGLDSTGLISALRPNIKLAYSTPGTAGRSSYSWSPVSGPDAVSNPFIPNPTATPIQTTTYSLIVTDPFGCKASDSIIIFGRSYIKDSTIATPPLCFGDSTGSLCFYASGGTAPYSYIWSSGDTSECRSHLFAGTYYISVTDHNGCVRSDSAVVSSSAKLSDTKVITNESCYGLCNGSILVTPYGGTLPYSFQWSNNYSNHPLCAGTYTLTITDANACQLFDTVIIRGPLPLVLDSILITNSSCGGANNGNGSLCPVVSGGTTPYSFLWNNFATGQCLTSLNAGTYSVTVTDSNDCKLHDSATIIQLAPLVAVVSSSRDTLLPGQSDTLTATASGGVKPYQYQWINPVGMDSSIVINQCANYIVNVSDSNACTITINYDFTACGPDSMLAVIMLNKPGPNIQLFPNPASRVLNIETELAGKFEISITDITGKQMAIKNNANGTHSVMDITDLNAGVYILNLKTDGQQWHRRFVKTDAP